MSNYTRERLADAIIYKMSFKRKLVGCGYILEALSICSRYPDGRATLSVEVYPVIAAKHGKTEFAVERAIRNAINDCFYHGNLKFLNCLLHSSVVADDYPPTNGEFLAALASFLYRLNLEEDIADLLDILKNKPDDSK